MALQNPIYIAVKELANRYGVGPATIWRWSREGNFPKPVKIGQNCTRWRLTEVEAWEEREVA